jgi:hypothetical protein
MSPGIPPRMLPVAHPRGPAIVRWTHPCADQFFRGNFRPGQGRGFLGSSSIAIRVELWKHPIKLTLVVFCSVPAHRSNGSGVS